MILKILAKKITGKVKFAAFQFYISPVLVSTQLLRVVELVIASTLIILNLYMYRGIGGVKSILVGKMPNYCRRQGIVMYNTMIPKNL